MNDGAGDHSLVFVDDVDMAEQAFRHDIDGILDSKCESQPDWGYRWIMDCLSLPRRHGHHPLAAVRGICYRL